MVWSLMLREEDLFWILTLAEEESQHVNWPFCSSGVDREVLLYQSDAYWAVIRLIL